MFRQFSAKIAIATNCFGVRILLHVAQVEFRASDAGKMEPLAALVALNLVSRVFRRRRSPTRHVFRTFSFPKYAFFDRLRKSDTFDKGNETKVLGDVKFLKINFSIFARALIGVKRLKSRRRGDVGIIRV